MAILTSLPGVEVTITVSNSALHELEDYGSRASPDSVSRYLEVQSDGIFEIKIATSLGALRGAGLDYEIFVDGNRADGFFIAPCHCADGGHEWVSKGWRLGNGHIRQYKLRAFETGRRSLQITVWFGNALTAMDTQTMSTESRGRLTAPKSLAWSR